METSFKFSTGTNIVRIMTNNLKGSACRCVRVCLVLMLTAALAWGQAISGDLVGTVTDQSGAAIPNVTVTITNTATGIKIIAKSNTSGEYRVGNLLVGLYSISASSPGFADAMLPNFHVELNKTATANLILSVAGVSSTVEVTDSAPAIDTTTAQVQTTFDQKQ